MFYIVKLKLFDKYIKENNAITDECCIFHHKEEKNEFRIAKENKKCYE